VETKKAGKEYAARENESTVMRAVLHQCCGFMQVDLSMYATKT
jgi:hypothetical protein